VSRFPTNIWRLRSARIGLLAFAAAFVVYSALGFWLVPRLVRSNLLGFASEQYGRTARLGAVTFNPYNLELELHQFSMPDADGAPLLAFDRLLLDFDISSVWRVGASFAEVQLDKPLVRLRLRPDGSLNLADLARLAHPAPSSASSESPRVFIDRLGVSGGSLAFEDRARARPFATELQPITFELRDFSTGGGSGNEYSLRAASLAGESFAWSGSFQLAPLTSSGRFEVAALQARTLWSYLGDAVPFEFTKGSIDLAGDYSYAAGDTGGLRFDVRQVKLADFGMRPRGRDYDFVEIAALGLDGTRVDVRRRRVDIGRVHLEGGALRVARDPEGRINLAELAGTNTAAPAAPAAPAAASTLAWLVNAPDIAVSALRVDLEDALVKPAARYSFTPVNLTLSGYTTAPDARLRFVADAHGENLGTLKMAGATSATFDDFTTHVEALELNLAALQPYLSTYTQITLASGQLNSALDVSVAARGPLQVKGRVEVSKLAAIDNVLRQDLLKWDRLTVSGIDYSSAPAKLAIGRIDARAPYARLIIAPDQTLNISRLFTPAAGATPPAVQSVRGSHGPQAPGGNPGAMRISIASVQVQSGSANFADYWIKPNYAVSLQELAGGISGLSSDPKSRARVDLDGRVDRYAPAQIQGTLNLLSAALYTDIHVKFDGVEMTSVTPYSGHFAGYAIEKGKLSIDVNYRVEDRKLAATQKFVIDQLQLGDRVDSPDAVKLPLKLAVALLKDRNGVIDLDLPLSGSLDDPQFRVGPLIWKAFVGLLGKIVTSPFTLLARLGGRSDEINQVDFDAGSAALDAAALERMTALSKALAERPSLELEVPTAYAPEADGHALALASLELRLGAAAQHLEAAARYDLLRKQFEKDLGAGAPLPATAASVPELRKKKDAQVPYEAANQELTQALLEKHPASDAELADLARARAQAIRDSLLGGGALDARRVFLLGIQPVASVGGRVRVELALK
jgi:hypothetical protein